MGEMLTPIGIAFIVLGVLLLFGTFALYRSLRFRFFVEPLLPRVIRLEIQDKGIFKRVVDGVRPPCALEIGIEQLGSDIHYYVVVPAKDLETVKRLLPAPASVIDDYEMYTVEGVHQVFTIETGDEGKGKHSISEFLDVCEGLDLSPVNEIGESVVVQLTMKDKKEGVYRVNVRLLVSAPTETQAAEILRAIKNSLPVPYTLQSITEGDYLYEMTFRKFNDAYARLWRK